MTAGLFRGCIERCSKVLAEEGGCPQLCNFVAACRMVVPEQGLAMHQDIPGVASDPMESLMECSAL